MFDELELETRKLYILIVGVCLVAALTFLYALLIIFGLAAPSACPSASALNPFPAAHEWRRG